VIPASKECKAAYEPEEFPKYSSFARKIAVVWPVRSVEIASVDVPDGGDPSSASRENRLDFPHPLPGGGNQFPLQLTMGSHPGKLRIGGDTLAVLIREEFRPFAPFGLQNLF
jgi:hypothetical protein